MQDQTLKDLLKRLDVLLSLKLNPLDAKANDQDKIKRLNDFSYTPTEIASVLGSTSDKISKQLYVIRNKKNPKK